MEAIARKISSFWRTGLHFIRDDNSFFGYVIQKLKCVRPDLWQYKYFGYNEVSAHLERDPKVAQHVFTNQEGIANNGYDVVNYFTTHTAARGNKDFSTLYNGVTYYFANNENLNSFKAAPGKYLPQFDEYCAFAVAKMNQKVPSDPETFRIDDGKLYLFYNDFWEGKPFNTIVPWINSEPEMEKLAVENWKTLKN